MRLMTIVWILIVALPLSAQTETQRPIPFDDIIYVETEIVPGAGGVPIISALFRGAQAPAPNGHAQVQQAIDKMMPGAREALMIDLDSVLLASAAKSLQHPFIDTEELRKLVGGLKSIQIRGFEVDGAVGPSLAAYRSKIQPIRDLLKAPLWVRYAANTSGNSELEIWSGRSGSTPTGVILLSITGGKRVFIMNVAGDLRPDQLIYLSGVLGIPWFELDLGKH